MGLRASKNDEAPSRTSSGRNGFRAGLISRGAGDIWEFYDAGQAIGVGMTGNVRIVTHKTTGQRYALKSLTKSRLNKDLLQDLRNEIGLLRQLDHPNVIKLYEWFETEKSVFLVLEYCSGGELFDRLKDQEGDHFSERMAANLISMMTSAVAYCHSKGISHRDLKLENFIFETEDAASNLKLIDFGLSRKYASPTGIRRMASVVGTPYYIAPEVAQHHQTYTQACDIWSVGVISYMLLSGRPPFKGSDNETIIRNVIRGRFTLQGPRWVGITDGAKNFIRKCLVYNPRKRASAVQLMHDPWIAAARAKRVGGATRPLDTGVVESLQAFSRFSTFKRAVLETIAFSMSADKIAHLREHFELLDEDGTGTLSPQEIRSALSRGGLSQEEADAVFSGMDQDGMEAVSYSEFLAAALSRRLYMDEALIKDAFRRLDTDRSGFITPDNLRQVLGDEYTPAKVEQMMREADSKGDGKIDEEEFLRMIRQEGLEQVRSLLPAEQAEGIAERTLSGLAAATAEAAGVKMRRHIRKGTSASGSVELEGGPSMAGSLAIIAEATADEHPHHVQEGGDSDDEHQQVVAAAAGAGSDDVATASNPLSAAAVAAVASAGEEEEEEEEARPAADDEEEDGKPAAADEEEASPADDEEEEEEAKPAAAAEEEETKPAAAADEESKPAADDEEEAKPAADDEEEDEAKPAANDEGEEEAKPAAADEEEARPAADEEEEEEEAKPAAEEEEEAKPAAADDEESKPAAADDEEAKPAAADEEEEEAKPAADEEEEEEAKPAAADEEETKPAEEEEEKEEKEEVRLPDGGVAGAVVETAGEAAE